MKCTNCGYENNDTSQYCSSCGSKMSYSQPVESGYDTQHINRYSYTQSEHNEYNQNNQTNYSGKGKAIGSLVCGIVSLVAMFSCVGIIPAIIAIALGAVGKGELRESNQSSGMTTAGIILGIFGIIAWVVSIIIYVAYFDYIFDQYYSWY